MKGPLRVLAIGVVATALTSTAGGQVLNHLDVQRLVDKADAESHVALRQHFIALAAHVDREAARDQSIPRGFIGDFNTVAMSQLESIARDTAIKGAYQASAKRDTIAIAECDFRIAAARPGLAGLNRTTATDDGPQRHGDTEPIEDSLCLCACGS